MGAEEQLEAMRSAFLSQSMEMAAASKNNGMANKPSAFSTDVGIASSHQQAEEQLEAMRSAFLSQSVEMAVASKNSGTANLHPEPHATDCKEVEERLEAMRRAFLLQSE